MGRNGLRRIRVLGTRRYARKTRFVQYSVKEPHTLYRPKIQIFRILWEFHAYDDDPFPSEPHGHSLNPYHKYKLDVYSGMVYDFNRQVGKASRKDLVRLFEDPKFQKLIKIAKEHSGSQRPNRYLRPTGSSIVGNRYRYRLLGKASVTFSRKVDLPFVKIINIDIAHK